MVSPIRPYEFILGKTVPFFLNRLGDVALVTVFGVLWFRIPFVGNPWVMLLGASLFLLAALGLGLLLSTFSRTQQQAFALTFFLVNPLFNPVGLCLPDRRDAAVPAMVHVHQSMRYFLVVIPRRVPERRRLEVLWPTLTAMGALGVGMLALSVLRFRKFAGLTQRQDCAPLGGKTAHRPAADCAPLGGKTAHRPRGVGAM